MKGQPPASGVVTRRLPKNYALLLDVVRAPGRGVHQTASQVYDRARVRRPGIGLATVHRGLARLCALGEVMKIDVQGGEAACYEAVAPPHAHLVCDGCASVSDVDYAIAPKMLLSIGERHGVRIARETLTFHGTCRRCMERRGAKLRRRPAGRV